MFCGKVDHSSPINLIGRRFMWGGPWRVQPLSMRPIMGRLGALFHPLNMWRPPKILNYIVIMTPAPTLPILMAAPIGKPIWPFIFFQFNMDIPTAINDLLEKVNSLERRLNTLGGAAGQANTASNIGVGGVGLYQQKVGVDLQFRNIAAGSAMIDVALDAPNNEVEIDIVSAQIDHNDLGGLQGGQANQYYHLNAIEHPYVSGVNAQSLLITASPTFAGLDLIANMPQTTSKARVQLSADQNNIADSVWTNIVCNSEDYDPGADFNAATGVFTAPVSGYYFVAVKVMWHETTATKSYYIGINHNGSIVSRTWKFAHTNGEWIPLVLSDVLYVAAAETLALAVFHNTGAATPDISGANYLTSITIHLLSV